MEKKKTKNRVKEIYRYKSTVVSDKGLAIQELWLRYVLRFGWLIFAFVAQQNNILDPVKEVIVCWIKDFL